MDVWSHFPGTWSHPSVKIVTMVTWYQFNGSKPQNDSDLDTRSGS